MIGIYFLLLAIFCQAPGHSKQTHHTQSSQVTTLDDTTGDDSGDPGDTGHVPPKPPGS